MIYQAKKVWLGHVSVRDYIVKKCLKDKEDLTIQFNGVSKTFPYKSLKTYLANSNGEIFRSKYTGKEYTLLDFPWTTSTNQY